MMRTYKVIFSIKDEEAFNLSKMVLARGLNAEAALKEAEIIVKDFLNNSYKNHHNIINCTPVDIVCVDW